jgi:hypothetical protein
MCPVVDAGRHFWVHAGDARDAVDKLAIQELPTKLRRDQLSQLGATAAVLARDRNYADQSSSRPS